MKFGGGGGIRTHGKLAPTSLFESDQFNHSCTPPNGYGCAPGAIRTHDPQFRKLVLYPAELRVQIGNFTIYMAR
jgi:hypothetical protein